MSSGGVHSDRDVRAQGTHLTGGPLGYRTASLVSILIEGWDLPHQSNPVGHLHLWKDRSTQPLGTEESQTFAVH